MSQNPCGGALFAALAACAAPAAAQTSLPPVTVTGNPLGSSDLIAPAAQLSGTGLTLRSRSTLGETLDRLPGVSSTYFGPNASRPVIRGLDGDRIRILDNGGTALDVSNLSYDHAVAADPLTVERIEVLRGPGSAVHGSNALHGVVAVLPRSPGDGGGLRLEMGADDYRRSLLSLDGETLRLDLNAVDAGSFRADEGHAQQQATLQWLPTGNVATRFAVSVNRLRQETAGFAFGEDAWRDARRVGNANPEAFRDADGVRAVLHHAHPWRGGEWQLRTYARDESQTFLQHFILGQPLEENGSTSLGLQAMGAFDGFRVGLDLEGADGRLRQTQARPLTTGTPAQNAQRPAGRHYDYAVDAMQVALFAENQWRSDADAITVGARLERMRYRHDNRMSEGNLRDDGTPCDSGGCLYLRPADRTDRFTGRSAQLGWTRELDAAWTLGARAARAFRFPQATELYRLQRGQSVEGVGPETADSLEATLRYRDATLRMEATAYAMRKRDVLLRDATGLNVFGAATRHRGIELAAAWTPDAAMRVEGQLAWSEQRYAFDRLLPQGEVIRRGARIDTAPEWLGGLRVGRRFGAHIDAELEGVWQGGYFSDAANTRRYGGHVLWHARFGIDVDANWRATLRLMNLADRRYAERVDFAFGEERSFPGAGRGVFIGVERRFE